ncbi:hypothetical protein D3C76_204170 [compost metagenome]
MWAIIAILGLALFIICIPALVFSIKGKKKGGTAVYIVLAGISYCIMLFGGLEAVKEYKALQKNAPIEAQAENPAVLKLPTEPSPAESVAAEEEQKNSGLEAEKPVESPLPEIEAPDEVISDEIPDEVISDEIPDQEEPPAVRSSIPEQITASGGIGDTLSVLKDEYGHNAGDDKQASFKRGVLTAQMLGNGRAYKLDYRFAGTLGDAMLAVNDMIPSDSVQLDSAVTNDTVVFSYSSEMLNSIVEPGQFIAKFTYTRVGKVSIVSHISINLGSLTKTKSEGETHLVTPM